MSEDNVKTNRTVSTKWTYHKERSFASSYFIFLKILLDEPTTQMSILIIFVGTGILYEGYFSLWVSLRQKIFIIALSNKKIFDCPTVFWFILHSVSKGYASLKSFWVFLSILRVMVDSNVYSTCLCLQSCS